MHVGVCDRDLRPRNARVWAVAVDDDRLCLSAFVHETTAPRLLEFLEQNPRLAIAVARPIDHWACQVKGLFEGSRPALEEERELVDRQSEGLFEALGAIGLDRRLMAGWKWWPSVALRLRITECYLQTPGPRAGEPME